MSEYAEVRVECLGPRHAQFKIVRRCDGSRVLIDQGSPPHSARAIIGHFYALLDQAMDAYDFLRGDA